MSSKPQPRLHILKTTRFTTDKTNNTTTTHHQRQWVFQLQHHFGACTPLQGHNAENLAQKVRYMYKITSTTTTHQTLSLLPHHQHLQCMNLHWTKTSPPNQNHHPIDTFYGCWKFKNTVKTTARQQKVNTTTTAAAATTTNVQPQLKTELWRSNNKISIKNNSK